MSVCETLGFAGVLAGEALFGFEHRHAHLSKPGSHQAGLRVIECKGTERARRAEHDLRTRVATLPRL